MIDQVDQDGFRVRLKNTWYLLIATKTCLCDSRLNGIWCNLIWYLTFNKCFFHFKRKKNIESPLASLTAIFSNAIWCKTSFFFSQISGWGSMWITGRPAACWCWSDPEAAAWPEYPNSRSVDKIRRRLFIQ